MAILSGIDDTQRECISSFAQKSNVDFCDMEDLQREIAESSDMINHLHEMYEMFHNYYKEDGLRELISNIKTLMAVCEERRDVMERMAKEYKFALRPSRVERLQTNGNYSQRHIDKLSPEDMTLFQNFNDRRQEIHDNIISEGIVVERFDINKCNYEGLKSIYDKLDEYEKEVRDFKNSNKWYIWTFNKDVDIALLLNHVKTTYAEVLHDFECAWELWEARKQHMKALMKKLKALDLMP